MAGLQPGLRARFFHGLADPSRLAILDTLRGGERTSGDVAAAAGLTVSNASRHLACLRDCGLVEARQEWRHVHYRLAEGVNDLLAASDAFIERAAERVPACARPEMGD
jgi:ArsR family transcriptional regulator, cadmium/lead-responsive transcriptional repressor